MSSPEQEPRTSTRFEIELSGNKQKHYGKQFSGAPTPSKPYFIHYVFVLS